MTLEKFINLHKIYSNGKLTNEQSSSKEYDEYIDAIDNIKECSDYYILDKLNRKGFKDIEKHCCLVMSFHLSTALDNKDGEHDVDVIVVYSKKLNEYGIPIHDGGTSRVSIGYCPWCGKKLPK